jgi:hypothetical protein
MLFICRVYVEITSTSDSQRDSPFILHPSYPSEPPIWPHPSDRLPTHHNKDIITPTLQHTLKDSLTTHRKTAYIQRHSIHLHTRSTPHTTPLENKQHEQTPPTDDSPHRNIEDIVNKTICKKTQKMNITHCSLHTIAPNTAPIP